MKTRLFLSAILVLLSLVVAHCGTSARNNTKTVTDVTCIPQGAYEQLILEYEGITDEEICRIYAGNVAYWNEVDRIMCGD